MKYVSKQILSPIEKRIKKELKNFLMKELEKDPYVDFSELKYGKYAYFEDRLNNGIKVLLTGPNSTHWDEPFCIISNEKIKEILEKRQLRKYLEALPDGGKSLTRKDKLKKLLK